MYIDAHTHLNSPKLFGQWKEYLDNFEKNGGKGLINAGSDEDYNNNGLIISKEYKGNMFVKCTIGLHPYEVESGKINKDNLEEEINKLEKLYLKNKKHIIAIGETGIDYSFNKGNSNIYLQKKLFNLQCKLAQKYDLPIIIHSRDDFDSTFDIIKNYKKLKIYFHCRGYDTKELNMIKNVLKKFWIGFCGNVTYPSANNIRRSLFECDLENILLETDAPYLSPQVVRGTTNEPKNVEYIYEYIYNQKNINKNILQKQIYKNFFKLYK